MEYVLEFNTNVIFVRSNQTDLETSIFFFNAAHLTRPVKNCFRSADMKQTPSRTFRSAESLAKKAKKRKQNGGF